MCCTKVPSGVGLSEPVWEAGAAPASPQRFGERPPLLRAWESPLLSSQPQGGAPDFSSYSPESPLFFSQPEQPLPLLTASESPFSPHKESDAQAPRAGQGTASLLFQNTEKSPKIGPWRFSRSRADKATPFHVSGDNLHLAGHPSLREPGRVLWAGSLQPRNHNILLFQQTFGFSDATSQPKGIIHLN